MSTAYLVPMNMATYDEEHPHLNRYLDWSKVESKDNFLIIYLEIL